MAEKLLSLLLTQAAAGTVLILLFLAARRVLKKHICPNLFYAAWLLVVVRMLIPIDLPNPLLSAAQMPQAVTSINAPAAVHTLTPEVTLLENKAAVQQADSFIEADKSASTANHEPIAEAGNASATSSAAHPANAAVSPIPPVLPTSWIVLILWVVGCLCTLIYMVSANKMVKKMACLKPIDLPDVKWPVFLSDLPSPCVLGAFRPVIVLTKESLSPENLNWVLKHETCHIRRHDPEWGILSNVICALFWFNPLVWLAAKLVRKDCELACDETVNRHLDSDERFDYAKTLLRLAGKPLPFAASAMSNTKIDMKERLENIMERKTWKRATSVFVAILLLAATALSFATAPVAAEQTLSPAAVDAFTENLTGYSAASLQQRLTDLENQYRTGHEMTSAYLDRAANFDSDTYWTSFIKALEKVNTRDGYLAFLNSRFPGINEAYPGDPSIALVMPRIDGMLRSVLGIDLALPRYETCIRPGVFVISGMDLNDNVRYKVETYQDNITYFATDYVYPIEVRNRDAAPADQAESDGRLAQALDIAKDFARHYLAGRDDDCAVGWDGNDDFKITSPARFDVSFLTGWRYRVEVDLATMRITRAELKEKGEVIPTEQDYLKAALPLEAINYDDLLSNIDNTTNETLKYLCEGTISSIIEGDPQIAIMVLGGTTPPLYVALSNASGEDWAVGSTYKVCGEPIGKYTALPKIAMSDGRSDYLPLLAVRYTFSDTENYSADQLVEKLTELENSYGGTSGGLDVYKSFAKAFDSSDLYMMNFARALMAVDSLPSYQALMSTRFPGINEALPGYTTIDQLRSKYTAMLRIALKADLVKCYWQYEACTGPGEFEIVLGEGHYADRYRIHYRNDAVTDLTDYASAANLENQVIVPFGQQTQEDLDAAATVARDFAVSYLYAGDMQCKMSFPNTELPKGQYPGQKPIQINMAIPDANVGYIIIVDIATMRVTQVTMSEMEVSEGGTVTPKQS